MNAQGALTAHRSPAMLPCARLLLRARAVALPFRRDALHQRYSIPATPRSSPSQPPGRWVARASLKQSIALTKADRFLRELNEEQQHAALGSHAGMLRLLAGPGSGKTRVIVAKIAHLIREGARPTEVLAVTFTNKAAQELKQRLQEVLPAAMAKQVTAGTFHGVCVGLLQRYPEVEGESGRLQVYDEDDAHDTLRKLLQGRQFNYQDKEARARADDVQAQLSLLCSVVPGAAHMGGPQLVEAGVARGVLQRGTPSAPSLYSTLLEELGRVIDAYWAALAAERAMDFDMILLRTLDVLKRRPEVLEKLHARYRYILVDEFQDTNQAQYELMKRLLGRGARAVVVGDVNQAIYSWRGACPENMESRLDADFGTLLATRSLQLNYRSHPDIIRTAQHVLASSVNAFGAPPASITPVRAPTPGAAAVHYVTAMSLAEEARFFARTIRRAHDVEGAPYDAFLALYRTHRRSRQLELALTEFGVPYVVLSGPGFWRLKEVRAALSYARLARRPDDPALRRVLKHVARGIGPKTIVKLDEYAVQLGATLAEVVLAGCHQVALPRDVLHEVLARLPEEGLAAVKGLAPALGEGLVKAVKPTKKAAAGLMEVRDLVALLYNVARWRSPGAVVRALRDAFYDAYVRAGKEEGKGEDLRKQRLKNLDLMEERGRRPMEAVPDMDALLQQQRLAAVAPAAAPPEAAVGGGPGEEPEGLPALDAFLDACSLETSGDAAKAEGKVRLMTVHGAKGLEADRVLLLGAEDGNLPLKRKDDGGPLASRSSGREELNLAYVAVTRARHQLWVSYVKFNNDWCGHPWLSLWLGSGSAGASGSAAVRARHQLWVSHVKFNNDWCGPWRPPRCLLTDLFLVALERGSVAGEA